MAFDRTKRFTEVVTSTPAQVGPRTYDIADPSRPARSPVSGSWLLQYRGAAETYTRTCIFPYSCLIYLQFFRIGIQSRIFDTLYVRFNNLQGGVSLDYTDVRFKEKICEGPSPAEYILPDDLFKKTCRKISHPDTWHGSVGKLWLIRPPRPLTIGLSVPSKRDVGGYDYDERGVLVKNLVIEPKPNDFYNVPRGETNFTTLRYKGNFWSKMKGRDDERTSVIPSPGEYEHETKKSPGQIRDERTREAKRAAAKQPRFFEALYQQKLRQVILRTYFVTFAVAGSLARTPRAGEVAFVSVNRLMEICFSTKNFPAPNHYDLSKGVFDRRECKCDLLTEPPPFNQTAKRFEENFQLDTPGPGTYEITIPQICYGSILYAPFGAFDDRFKRTTEVAMPGPADYHTEVGTLAFESAKRFKNEQKIFNCLNFCKTLTSISDDDEYKGIDKCIIAKKVDEEKYPVYHAVFKSRVDRFPKIRTDVPESGAYETLSAFKANRDRCDFLCWRLAPPFGSRASRFPMISEGDFHVPGIKYQGDFHVPGPAHYDLRGDISRNVKNGVIYSAPREKKKDAEGPGPQHYHIHPYIASFVSKKSFNVTLGKPKIIERINKIQIPWHQRRSKKTLRWFAVPRERYQHCNVVSL